MKNGKCTDQCSNTDEPEHFPDGITNGAAWYPISGGMQDWNYVQADCFELTIELGCRKYPSSDQLSVYWEANMDSLIELINAVHIGIRGYVYDVKVQPIEGAIVSVAGLDKNVSSHQMGDYFRLLAPNRRYTVSVHKSGYKSQSITVYVEQAVAQSLDFTLVELP